MVTSWSKPSSYTLVHLGNQACFSLSLGDGLSTHSGSKEARVAFAQWDDSITSVCLGLRDMNDVKGLLTLLKAYICGQHRDQQPRALRFLRRIGEGQVRRLLARR